MKMAASHMEGTGIAFLEFSKAYEDEYIGCYKVGKRTISEDCHFSGHFCVKQIIQAIGMIILWMVSLWLPPCFVVRFAQLKDLSKDAVLIMPINVKQQFWWCIIGKPPELTAQDF
ncbi:PREDICTED: uncharacterized protein LOC109590004 isoform X3 [Amphimedon queenslandica]|uniref:Uncharacterized protein n=1 Tax=Amphimedon queenslandica TaxID=400682 RepID=A0AAN0JX92_AMPQE|nr:PREDICTED: uncharacterized protein LOC109590004 isoform X3 [Amphimedon queenslandica]|eukprot:XP_019861526.1 PREDICTED: uncharacterized protein LOC109590004 isoform X3 [Amphimedon queenslandica]